jgi:hypothetical protein
VFVRLSDHLSVCLSINLSGSKFVYLPVRLHASPMEAKPSRPGAPGPDVTDGQTVHGPTSCWAWQTDDQAQRDAQAKGPRIRPKRIAMAQLGITGTNRTQLSYLTCRP